MRSLLTLPLEIRRCVPFALENASDLLHLALTCKSFYELIIPTHHLDLVSISCSDSEAPLEFWEKLNASQHFGSMIRQLEICDNDVFDDLSHRRVFRGRRIDGEFVIAWTGSSPRLLVTPASASQGLIQSLSGTIEGLTSVTILKRPGEKEYDGLLYYLSKRFSQSLKTLHVRYGFFSLPDGYVPRYEPSDCSFHHLTTFSLCFGFNGTVPEPFYLLLDNLVSSCHTLVEFALAISSYQSFPCLRWVKKAHWPSLKKLTLTGRVRLLDGDKTTPQEEIVDAVLSFFGRHSKLECLYLDRLGDNMSDAVTQFLTQPNERLQNILPSLWSFGSTLPIPPEILPRLRHVTHLNYTPPKFYHLAQSLRSCDLRQTTLETLQAIVKNIPQLERLAMAFVVTEDYSKAFTSLWDGVPSLIADLEDLTHLELYLEGVELEDMCTTEDFAEHLPFLRYSHVWGENYESEWTRIIVDLDDPQASEFESLEDSPDQSFKSECWGEFFTGPAIEL